MWKKSGAWFFKVGIGLYFDQGGPPPEVGSLFPVYGRLNVSAQVLIRDLMSCEERNDTIEEKIKNVHSTYFLIQRPTAIAATSTAETTFIANNKLLMTQLYF